MPYNNCTLLNCKILINMKKVIFALVILTFTTFSMVSCRETKEKTIIIEKEVKEEAKEREKGDPRKGRRKSRQRSQ